MTTNRGKTYCSVFGCLNNDFANPDLSFFTVPTEPEMFTKTRSDGRKVNLRIQEMPAEYLDAAIDMHSNHFTKEEPFHRATGIFNSEHAKAESRELMKGAIQMLNAHVSICCVDDDPDKIGELAGVSVMYLSDGKVDWSKIQVESKELKKLLEVAIKELQCYDVPKEQNVEKYYDDLFIVVHPDFRRLGIAKEFVKARRIVCKQDNVAVAGSWMSAWGTQKAGEDDGWETVVELPYDDLSRRYDLVFEDAPPTNKYMIARITE